MGSVVAGGVGDGAEVFRHAPERLLRLPAFKGLAFTKDRAALSSDAAINILLETAYMSSNVTEHSLLQSASPFGSSSLPFPPVRQANSIAACLHRLCLPSELTLQTNPPNVKSGRCHPSGGR